MLVALLLKKFMAKRRAGMEFSVAKQSSTRYVLVPQFIS
jgi:hypothetical protein